LIPIAGVLAHARLKYRHRAVPGRCKEQTMGYVIALVCAGVLTQQPPARSAAGADPLALVNEARRLVADGRIQEGLERYRRALQAQPDLFEAHLGAGIALDIDLRFAEARKHLSKALELAPAESKVQALNALAVSYAFEGNAREAASFYQQVFDRHMADSNFGSAAGTANALGRVYLETGDVENARRWYETGYETARRQADAAGAQLSLWELRWLHAQGRIAARSGRVDEARAHVAAARALITKDPSLKDEWPTWHYLDGYVALFAKDYAAAVDTLQKADERDPFVLALLARAYEGAGNAARAQETWRQVLKSTGHSLQVAFSRPEAARKTGAR
jgi:tetratricopeptide (TPR) repeat protein